MSERETDVVARIEARAAKTAERLTAMSAAELSRWLAEKITAPDQIRTLAVSHRSLRQRVKELKTLLAAHEEGARISAYLREQEENCPMCLQPRRTAP